MPRYDLTISPAPEEARIMAVSAKITRVVVVSRDQVTVVTKDDLTKDEEQALVDAVALIKSAVVRIKIKEV